MSEKKEITVIDHPTYYEMSPNIKMFKSDAFTALQFRDMVFDKYFNKNIKLDLSNVEFLDSTTIGILLEMGKKLKKKGLKLYLCNAYYAGRHLMELLNPQSFFAISEEEIMTLPDE